MSRSNKCRQLPTFLEVARKQSWEEKASKEKLLSKQAAGRGGGAELEQSWSRAGAELEPHSPRGVVLRRGISLVVSQVWGSEVEVVGLNLLASLKLLKPVPRLGMAILNSKLTR